MSALLLEFSYSILQIFLNILINSLWFWWFEFIWSTCTIFTSSFLSISGKFTAQSLRPSQGFSHGIHLISSTAKTDEKKIVSVQCFCHLRVFFLSLGCQHYSVKQRNLIMFKQLEQCLISFDSQATGESHSFGHHLEKNTGQELLSTVWMQLHCYKW